ncbi:MULTISPECIES: hypothetical protein [unclassified Myroides]|uniref:hypothetical protein n=1 Tax=unclassified Myroides TaxID=2642485 RepID=UPI003D2F62E4
MKLYLSIFLLFLSIVKINAQCLDESKVKIGGSYQSDLFIDPCPYYNYFVDAEKSSTGYHYSNRPIDLVPTGFAEIKKNLEDLLVKKVGEEMVSKLKFKGVSISVYDSIRKFEARYPVVDMSKCMTKYFFYYDFEPAEGVSYCLGIALDDYQQLISPLLLPETEEKLALDYSLDVCKILQIAKATETKFEPVDFVSFEFDPDKKEFFWVVRQQIINPKKGVNEYNQILIEARDATQVVSYRRTVYIE